MRQKQRRDEDERCRRIPHEAHRDRGRIETGKQDVQPRPGARGQHEKIPNQHQHQTGDHHHQGHQGIEDVPRPGLAHPVGTVEPHPDAIDPAEGEPDGQQDADRQDTAALDRHHLPHLRDDRFDQRGRDDGDEKRDEVFGHALIADEGGQRRREDQEGEDGQKHAEGHVPGQPEGIVAPQPQTGLAQNAPDSAPTGPAQQAFGIVGDDAVGDDGVPTRFGRRTFSHAASFSSGRVSAPVAMGGPRHLPPKHVGMPALDQDAPARNPRCIGLLPGIQTGRDFHCE